ncbi:hypothetical protein [Hyphomonas atlantica]|uniref:hypothetical protein n=1 Tax=Hyphomonas atlantica TaxID=1280948 RepID=UPI00351331A8
MKYSTCGFTLGRLFERAAIEALDTLEEFRPANGTTVERPCVFWTEKSEKLHNSNSSELLVP